MKKQNLFLLNVLVIFLFSLTTILAKKKNPHLEEGEKAFARGAYDKALEALENAIRSGEESGRAYFFIGQIFEARKKYKEAIPYYAKAVERPLDKNYKNTTLWKLILLTKEFGEPEDCLHYIDQLEALGVRHENLTKIRQEMEAILSPELKEALVLLQEVEKKEQELSPYRNEKNFYQIYKLDIIEIAQKLERSFRLYPKNRENLWKAAFYYEKTQEIDKALELYQELLLHTDEAYKAWYKIGSLKRRKGNFQEALEAFEKAIPKKSNPLLEYQVYLQKAQSYFGLEKFHDAVSASSLALKVKPKEFFALALYCLSLIKIAKEDTICQNSKTSPAIGTPIENTIFHFFLYEKSRQKEMPQEAKLHAQKALLSLDSPTSEEEEKLPKWLQGEVKKIFLFFWQEKDYHALWQLKDSYGYLFGDNDSLEKLATAAYELKRWKDLYYCLQNLPHAKEQHDFMWEKALLELGYYQELSNYLWEKYSQTEEKRLLLGKKLDEITYSRFALSDEGKKLKEKLKSKNVNQ